jgi:hypothetical protein
MLLRHNVSLLRQSKIVTEYDRSAAFLLRRSPMNTPRFHVPEHAHGSDQLIYAIRGLRAPCATISANLFGMFFLKLPQKRHPERSTSQIYRVTQRLVARSRRTPRVLILPMLFGPFRPPKPENRIASPAFELFFSSDGCANVFVTLKVEQALAAIGRSETFQRALLMLHDAQIQIAGDANVKRACMAAENVDVAAGHSKMLAVLVVGPRESRGGPARCGLQWLKRSERHG